MTKGRRPPEDEAWPEVDGYAELILEADRWARAGEWTRLRQLRAELREQVEAIEKHLPERWRLRDVEFEYAKEGRHP